ncbi:dihydrolipoamide acetyltransferase family protein [Novosphingobium sp. BL-52-GroH]|uniref:dihydrolipoamide acetyltransferase family protein n=1 Tax=Novosphingobium sp. BL-52-GroH TaxID=3349877 RepID=UPI00384DF2CB
MTFEIKMPALSPTMEKGTLARWLVGPGDVVKAGDMLAEIETDKATMEMEAAEDGRIASIVVPEGSADVAVGTVIALLGDGEGGAAGPGAAPLAVPVVEVDVPALPLREAPAPVVVSNLDTTHAATPLARRIAGAKGIDLGGIAGSGPRGQIVLADLNLPSRTAMPIVASPVAQMQAPVRAVPPEGVPVRTEKLSTMRKTIARRLTESKQTVPHFYLTVRCNIDPLLRLRGAINETLADRGIKLSVNDLLVKAMARALGQVPEANVQFAGEELHRFDRVDIAMAVAIEGGLVTPVIRDVASLSPGAIAQASKALAAKAREGRLMPQDYEGGTATISNLGMFGIDEMVPVINPPQAMILGIGAGIEQPWKVDGEIGLATVMAATGSFDHRAIDGAVAARFMAAFREMVEAPMLIVA